MQHDKGPVLWGHPFDCSQKRSLKKESVSYNGLERKKMYVSFNVLHRQLFVHNLNIYFVLWRAATDEKGRKRSSKNENSICFTLEGCGGLQGKLKTKQRADKWKKCCTSGTVNLT